MKRLAAILLAVTAVVGATTVAPTPSVAATSFARASLTTCDFDAWSYGSSAYNAAYWASFGSANQAQYFWNPYAHDVTLVTFNWNSAAQTSTGKWRGVNIHGNTIYFYTRTPRC